MPTYDYRCKRCGNTFEHFQKMTDKPLEVCDTCGGELKRLIGAGLGPIFKGSGFYQTDYKNGSSNKSTSPTKTSSSTESKSETKKVSDKKNPA